MSIGQRIRDARKKAGMTQAELAEKLGISYVGVSQWERDIRNPKQETIQRLSDALGCDFYWLLWGEELPIEERKAIDVMRFFCTDDFHIKKAAKLAVHYSEVEHREKGYSFSKCETELISFFTKLNDKGQAVAVERVEELTEIEKYQRTTHPSEATQEDAEDT